MGSPSSLPAAAAALVLLALLAGGGHCREAQFDATDAAGAGAENFNTSDAAVYWGPWQKARATWYGQPNGAGPDDNGERYRHSSEIFFLPLRPQGPRACYLGALWWQCGSRNVSC
jgi:hypothetical protein